MSAFIPEFGIRRENEERRDGGCAVIYNPATGLYAVGEREADGLLLLFAGGVEEGEDVVAGILREVREESGLHEFAHVEKVAEAITHYHNTAKKVNRVAHATCLLVVLRGADALPVVHEPHEHFSLTWKTPDEIRANWHERNREKGFDHWLYFLEKATGRMEALERANRGEPQFRVKGGYAGVLIPTFRFAGLPESIDVAGGTLLKKTEFHSTILHLSELADRIAKNLGVSSAEAEARLLAFFNEFVRTTPVWFEEFVNEFRVARKDDRKSLVVRCRLRNLEELFVACEREFQCTLERQPAHVTLYTKERDQGIGIDTIPAMERLPVVAFPELFATLSA